MARKQYECPKCDRSFSMPAHLARHVSAIHGRKTGKKVVKKKGPKAKRGAPRAKRVAKKKARRTKARATARWKAAGGDAARLISTMRAYHRDLLIQRRALDAQIDAVTRAMRTVGAV